MKKRIIASVLLVVMLLMMCGCSDPDKAAKDEVDALIKEYQDAVNRGDYDAADACCVLEDGKTGTWAFREYEVEITEDTPSYLVAAQQLSDERFFIDIYNIDVYDDTAIVETCFYQCSTGEAVNGISEYFDNTLTGLTNVDECKAQMKDYINAYTFMFAANLECKKINGVWKLTKLN